MDSQEVINRLQRDNKYLLELDAARLKEVERLREQISLYQRFLTAIVYGEGGAVVISDQHLAEVENMDLILERIAARREYYLTVEPTPVAMAEISRRWA